MASAEPQKFGIGLKELWEIAPQRTDRPVQHSFGWPLDDGTGGGRSSIISTSAWSRSDSSCTSTIATLTFAVDEFQRFKTTAVRDTFAGGKRLAYGRAPSPKAATSRSQADFPGGALIGCGAGSSTSAPQGHHNACFPACWPPSISGKRLRPPRQRRAASYEQACALPTSGAISGRCVTSSPWSRSARWRHCAPAASICGRTHWASRCWERSATASPIGKACKAPRNPCHRLSQADGRAHFRRLSSVFLSNTNHEEDQPVHLEVADQALQVFT